MMNRLACVLLLHFMAQIEDRERGLGGAPLVVVQDEQVIDYSRQAGRAGVHKGDTLYQAKTRCPSVQIVEANPRLYEQVWALVLDALIPHAPMIEETCQGVAYIEAKGMGALYGDESCWCEAIREEISERTSLTARIGVAETRSAAYVAAVSMTGERGYMSIQSSARVFMGPLLLHWLPLSNETRRRLDILGIRTCGQFARLPRNSVAEQFGPESLQFHAWAQGKDDGPLRSLEQRKIEVIVEFDPPENRQAALLEMSKHAVAANLQEVSNLPLTWQRMVVKLQSCRGELWQRDFWLRSGSGRVWSYLDELFSNTQGQGEEVGRIDITLIGLELVGAEQLDLFTHTRERLQQQELLHELAKKYPAGCVAQIRTRNPSAHLVRDRYRIESYLS